MEIDKSSETKEIKKIEVKKEQKKVLILCNSCKAELPKILDKNICPNCGCKN